MEKTKKLKKAREKGREENAKKLLLVFVKVKLGVRIPSRYKFFFVFVKLTFLTNTSKKHKNVFESEKNVFYLYFS